MRQKLPFNIFSFVYFYATYRAKFRAAFPLIHRRHNDQRQRNESCCNEYAKLADKIAELGIQTSHSLSSSHVH